jgi:hypothetical protein
MSQRHVRRQPETVPAISDVLNENRRSQSTDQQSYGDQHDDEKDSRRAHDQEQRPFRDGRALSLA